MNLSQRSLSNIDMLSELIHERNKARVVSIALEIAIYMIEKARNEGGKLTILSKDGSAKELKLVI